MPKVMVVDDEAVITTQLEERLKRMGYDVTESASFGEEAIRNARRFKPDVVLMDIVMPHGKLDGIDAAKIINSELDIPIIFLTAYTNDMFLNRAKYVEPFGYIVKPFQEREIKATIDIAVYKKDIERKIKKSNSKKELFLKEIHHRVRNDFQSIASLLNLQSRYIKNEVDLRYFKESQNRVNSLVLMYEKLAHSRDLVSISISDYIDSLLKSFIQSYNIKPRIITYKANIEKINISIKTAIPCGLIINELVSNASKYAFIKSKKGKKNEIKIELRKGKKHNIILVVSDNGKGFPEDLDFRNTKSLGMQIVCGLVEQLDASIRLDRGKGTTFTIVFKQKS